MTSPETRPETRPEIPPEPDRQDGAPHPRETARLFGQEAAERAFLDAWTGGRLHHAWLIAGPRGVGKATLAWRIARFLLTAEDAPEGGLFGAPPPPETLDPPREHPALPRILALSEPRLFLCRRPPDPRTGRLRQVITVDEIRRLKAFFQLSATEGGRRVVILDSADEMNPAAANALLKLLEEPPPLTTLLLVAHQPQRLLPTIRSRCRMLTCRPLAPRALEQALIQAGHPLPEGADAAMLTELAAGSAGEAVALLSGDGPGIYRALVALLGPERGIDRPAAVALAESCAGRGAEERYRLTGALILRLLHRLAVTGATGRPPPEAVPGEAALLTRLSPDAAAGRAWADLAALLDQRLAHARAVNLDPASVILDMVLKLGARARATPRAA